MPSKHSNRRRRPGRHQTNRTGHRNLDLQSSACQPRARPGIKAATSQARTAPPGGQGLHIVSYEDGPEDGEGVVVIIRGTCLPWARRIGHQCTRNSPALILTEQQLAGCVMASSFSYIISRLPTFSEMGSTPTAGVIRNTD